MKSSLELEFEQVIESMGFEVIAYQELSVTDPINSVYSQWSVAPYAVDFLCPWLRTAFEIDGHYWHSSALQKIKGAERDQWLRRQGFIVVHIPELWFKNKTVYRRVRSLVYSIIEANGI